jgi:hypothetical protein
MPALTSAAWVVHDVGLAASIGGSMFGKMAFEPALERVTNTQQRDRVEDDVWSRFGLINVASHLAFAVPWFIGRRMLDGSEVTGRAWALTRIKDVCVGASLVTGIASVVLGRMLGRRLRAGRGEGEDQRSTRALDRAVGIVGMLNLAATSAVGAVTTLLSMEASKSFRFAGASRCLP